MFLSGRFFLHRFESLKKYAQIGSKLACFPMRKNPQKIDNFARFLRENSDESNGIEKIMNAIDQIPDPVLRQRIYSRMNVELGVILLRKVEIQEELHRVFHAEFMKEGYEKVEELLQPE